MIMPPIRLRNRYDRRFREQRRDHARVVRAQNNGGQNVDSYKRALSMPNETEPFKLGPMSEQCSACGAKHFKAEETGNINRSLYKLCCHKGKVLLTNYTSSDYLEALIRGIHSPDRELRKKSQNYLENIRSYNSAFAMVSSESHLDESVLGGIYNFRIHNSFYHRIGTLLPTEDNSPKYAQIYLYDVNTATEQRLRNKANQNCDRTLMQEIALHLNEVNAYVRSFRTMADICLETGNNEDISMYIVLDKDSDIRRYNDAVTTDVAAIFRAKDGEPPGERNMVIYSKLNGIRRVSVLEPSLDPMAYPLLFPMGDSGWHPDMTHEPGTSLQRNRLTMLQYASYRLSTREGFSLLHRSQKLFLQWVVDIYVRIEGTRLSFIRSHQSQLRADLYLNLSDFMQQRARNQNLRIGKQVILPSSFIGSPRNMNQNYLDSMAIVQKFGKPSLFITMTCNPKWTEIVQNLEPGESAHFRPDLIVRVFHTKLKELISGIIKKHIFGKALALIYTIEFQKRGLPHAHILLTLDEEDRIRDTNDIDQIVHAYIPDQTTHSMLYDKVKKHMIHGPCGVLNPQAPCMKDGNCTKHFPKDFNETTRDNVNGYAVYKRPDNNESVHVRGKTVDNRYVVPYNPYLLAKFDCHINVEVCSTVKSIKYIYKYIYKGYDCATLRFSKSNDNEVVYDEVDSYLNCRYVGSVEAAWRIFEYEMHFQTHHVERLDLHLPGQQVVYFREGAEEQVVANPRQTKLQAFFKLNQIDDSANNLLYLDIPQHYVWNDSDKKWTKRQRGGNKVISRMYTVSPKNKELFHLRLLLLHVRGVKNFDDVKTFDGVTYHTFEEAAHARGIATNNQEWRTTLLEAATFNTPNQLRQIFAVICALNSPTNAIDLWEEFKPNICEDYLQSLEEEIAYNRGLIDIDDILITHNTSCIQIGLPAPTRQFQDEVEVNVIDELNKFNVMQQSANEEQLSIINEIITAVTSLEETNKVYCLTALGGCGKTFVQKAIMHKLRSLGLACFACAYSGIAASLLEGGRTIHNMFKLPVPINESSVSGIKINSEEANRLKNCSLIIIDEISMCPLSALNTIDRLLRDIRPDRLKALLFGGVPVLMCGDFRQTLPVVPHSGRTITVENCVKNYHSWHLVKQLSLNRNMRALDSESDFAKFIKQLGDGNIATHATLGLDVIQIPNEVVGTGSVIEFVYGNIKDMINNEDIIDRAILTPKNEDCIKLNNRITSTIPGEERTYLSCDAIMTDDEQERSRYPTEFLNSLCTSGLPPHRLILKENALVMLIRNLDITKGLINGTRLRVKRLHGNTIDCEVLTGASIKQRILIPKVHMQPSDKVLPFNLQRTQFPIIPAFAMTINKAQGQSIAKVGIYLPKPVFSHGQLYVAASRAKSYDGLKIFVEDTADQGRLYNDDRVFTKNIVYKELL